VWALPTSLEGESLIDAKRLLGDLQKQMRTLERDLLGGVDAVPARSGALQQRYAAAKSGSRTGLPFETWRSQQLWAGVARRACRLAQARRVGGADRPAGTITLDEWRACHVVRVGPCAPRRAGRSEHRGFCYAPRSRRNRGSARALSVCQVAIQRHVRGSELRQRCDVVDVRRFRANSALADLDFRRLPDLDGAQWSSRNRPGRAAEPYPLRGPSSTSRLDRRRCHCAQADIQSRRKTADADTPAAIIHMS